MHSVTNAWLARTQEDTFIVLVRVELSSQNRKDRVRGENECVCLLLKGRQCTLIQGAAGHARVHQHQIWICLLELRIINYSEYMQNIRLDSCLKGGERQRAQTSNSLKLH